MELCFKDKVDICILRRDDDNRFMSLPIIELEFEKDNLDPHIIIRGESIQLRMKKEKPTFFERSLQFGYPKKFCRSSMELYRDCTEPLQEGRAQLGGDPLSLLQKNQKTRKKILKNIQ